MTDYTDIAGWVHRLPADDADREDHLNSMARMIRGAHGQGYSGESGGTYLPENHYFSYLTATVPGLIFDNPRVSVRTRRPGDQDKVAEAMRHGLNRWVRDENLREVGKQVAVDYCFNWGIMMVTQEIDKYQGSTKDRALFDEDGHLNDEPGDRFRPRVYRIPQQLWFVDSRAITFDKAEYMGHIWFAGVSALEAELASGDHDWDAKAIRDLISEQGSPRDAAGVADPDRDNGWSDESEMQLEFRNIWVPGLVTGDKTPNEGYNGTILTMARANVGSDSRSWRFVKDPEAYFGPSSGPYEVFGAYTVPNKLWPLSPLVAVDGHIKEVNRHAKAISRANAKGKRVVLYDQKNKKDAARIKNAQSDFLVGVEGLSRDKIVQAEFGFATDAQYKGIAFHRDQLQRDSGMNDAAQGQVTGVGTARENDLANQVSMTRRGALYQEFATSMSRVLMKAGHWFYYDDTVAFPLGDEVEGYINPWFEGGLHAEDEGATYDDLELEIEAYSMGRIDQANMQTSVVQFTQYLLQTLQFRGMAQFVDWEGLDDLWAQHLNMPELAKIVDNEAAAEQGPFQDGGQDLQPRFQRDAGPRYDDSFTQGAGSAQMKPPSAPKALGMGSPGGNGGLQPAI